MDSRGSRFIVPVLLLGAVGFGVAYWRGMVSESVAGGVVASLVSGTVGFALLKLTLPRSTGKPQTVLAITLAVLTAALSWAPAFVAVAPGAPIAGGDLHKVGDRVDLPQGFAAPVRIFVHGRLGGSGATELNYTLAAGAAEVDGKLERTIGRARVARRAYTPVTRERASDLLLLDVPSGTDAITLSELSRASGDLHIEVYREPVPPIWELPLAALVVLAVAGLAVVLGCSSAAPFAATLAATFGYFVNAYAPPDAIVQNEIGALIAGIFIGAVGGTVLHWLARKIVHRPVPKRA